jgi:hypothetical protein
MTVSIVGLSLAQVLAGLYNAASPFGMGFLQYDPSPLTVKDAENILHQLHNFDYLKGRPLKISLDSEFSIDPELYDRDQGYGAAQDVVNEVRHTGNVNSPKIQAMHAANLKRNAPHALAFSGTKSYTTGNALYLGADNLGTPLREAINKALELTETKKGE